MKRLLLGVLFLFFAGSARAVDQKLVNMLTTPIIVKNIDIRTWPDSVSAVNAFDIFNDMMADDPETRKILSQVQQKLSKRGISDIHSILSFCANDSSLGNAYFNEDIKMVATRVVIPGVSIGVWPNSALLQSRNAFAARVVKTRFIDFLLVAGTPNICLKKTDNLLLSYDAFVHEMLHFVIKDAFKEKEDGILAVGVPDLLNSMVTQSGGEFDAYKAGLSAEIKFIKRNKINLQNGFYRFFDERGKLTDEAGLKESVLKIYEPYYHDPKIYSDFLKSRLDFIQWQIQTLKNVVQPLVLAEKNKELESIYADELNRLNAQQTLLSKQIK